MSTEERPVTLTLSEKIAKKNFAKPEEGLVAKIARLQREKEEQKNKPKTRVRSISFK